MKHLSIIEIAKLTAMITKGGFKRTATKDIALAKFSEAVAARKETNPEFAVPDNWALGLTFSEAGEKLSAILSGKQKEEAVPEKKGKKAAKAKNGNKAKKEGAGNGRSGGLRDKRLVPTVNENPFRSGKSLKTFAAILDNPGQTYRQYVADGLRINTIALAIRQGWLSAED